MKAVRILGALAAIGLAGFCLAVAAQAQAESADLGDRGDSRHRRDLDRPNLILILTDDQTYESIEKMPYVNGRDDWIRFDQAVLNNPLCCPARAGLLSGQYSHHSGVETNSDAPKLDQRSTLAFWLDRAGYRTGFIGKYLNAYPWFRGDSYVPKGWDRWFAFKGPLDYYGNTAISNGSLRSVPGYITDEISQRGVQFVERSRKRPFLLFLSHFAPHGPAIAAARHEGLFDSTPVVPRPNFNEEDVSDKPAWIQALPLQDEVDSAAQQRMEWGALQPVDEGVRELFGALRRRGIMRETVVVFLSDNGVALGSHRAIGKPCAYEECVRTPLLIRYPKQPGRTESALASNVDLPVTLARIAGVRPTSEIDGRDLSRVLEGTRELRRRHALLRGAGDGPSASPEFWGLRSARFKYVELAGGEVELYDLDADPFELENIAGTTPVASLQRELAAELQRRIEAPPRLLGRSAAG